MLAAAATSLPVIGVPVPLRRLDGLDFLLSIAQMRVGIPVATVAIAGARNALLVRILATADPALSEWVRAFQAQLAESARPTDAHVRTDTDNQGA
jgi:5-(carboxyamino)imidazole ribonucleotide mutase